MSRKDAFLMERAADLFDLPHEIIAGVSRITVTGGMRVFIENHKGLVEYSREKVTVNGGKMLVSVTGSELDLRSMSESDLLVTGYIRAVTLER